MGAYGTGSHNKGKTRVWAGTEKPRREGEAFFLFLL
jgi:hypothetical protein